MTFACETPPTGAAAAFALALQGQLPTLLTDHLILRAPRVDDFDVFARIVCSDRGRFVGGPMTREDAWAEFANMTANWLLHGHGAWTIANSAGVAGFVIIGFEPGDREPELGFLLTADAEGRGIAFEAACAARDYAWNGLGWDTLVSYVDPGNARSVALAQRLGAHPDGEITQDGGAFLVFRHHRGAQ